MSGARAFGEVLAPSWTIIQKLEGKQRMETVTLTTGIIVSKRVADSTHLALFRLWVKHPSALFRLVKLARDPTIAPTLALDTFLRRQGWLNSQDQIATEGLRQVILASTPGDISSPDFKVVRPYCGIVIDQPTTNPRPALGGGPAPELAAGRRTGSIVIG